MFEKFVEPHSPEPWYGAHMTDSTTSCNCTAILSNNGTMGGVLDVIVDNGLAIADGGNDGPSLEEAKSNAARTIACVNALKGIPTGWLETIVWFRYPEFRRDLEIDVNGKPISVPQHLPWVQKFISLFKANKG